MNQTDAPGAGDHSVPVHPAVHGLLPVGRRSHKNLIYSNANFCYATKKNSNHETNKCKWGYIPGNAAEIRAKSQPLHGGHETLLTCFSAINAVPITFSRQMFRRKSPVNFACPSPSFPLNPSLQTTPSPEASGGASEPQRCKSDEFQCHNQRCVRALWKCDGDDDCLDGSDEESHSCCEEAQISPAHAKNKIVLIRRSWEEKLKKKSIGTFCVC